MAQRTARKTIKADNPVFDQYYSLLDEYRHQRVKHEGAVSTAFENLLTTLAKQRGWVFIPLLAVTGKRLVPDGTIRDGNGLPRAYWEAKDYAARNAGRSIVLGVTALESRKMLVRGPVDNTGTATTRRIPANCSSSVNEAKPFEGIIGL